MLDLPELFQAGSGRVIEFDTHGGRVHGDLRGEKKYNLLQQV